MFALDDGPLIFCDELISLFLLLLLLLLLLALRLLDGSANPEVAVTGATTGRATAPFSTPPLPVHLRRNRPDSLGS